MWKSDTNANVLPSKSPWSSQLKLILNFPPQCLVGAGGAGAASRFPNSQVVTLPATTASHRSSSECAVELAWESGDCPGTIHHQLPTEGPASRGSVWALLSWGPLLAPRAQGRRPRFESDLERSRPVCGQVQSESCSHRLPGRAPPTWGSVASEEPVSSMVSGVQDAWTPLVDSGWQCPWWWLPLSGTQESGAPIGTGPIRPPLSRLLLCSQASF